MRGASIRARRGRRRRRGQWDAQTFDTWIRRNTVTRGAATLLEIAVEAVWAAEPADVSLLHVLFYTAAAGSFDALIGTEGGAQQDRFVGGSQTVPLRLAERIAGPLVPRGAGAPGRPFRGRRHRRTRTATPWPPARSWSRSRRR